MTLGGLLHAAEAGTYATRHLVLGIAEENVRLPPFPALGLLPCGMAGDIQLPSQHESRRKTHRQSQTAD